MTKLIHSFKLALTVVGGSLVLGAPAAFAGDMSGKMDVVDSKVMTTESAPESRTLTMKAEIEAEVRGAVARGEYIAVQGEDGRVYYNRVVAVETLPDPTLELETLQTFTTDYKGMTFTNQVVQAVD